MRNRYCGQVSPKIFAPSSRARATRSAPSGGRDVDDEQRRVEEAGEGDGAIDRLDLGRGGMADRMVARLGVAGSNEAVGDPLDDAAVFGMDHGQCAIRLGHRQDVEELRVVDPHQVVGHEDLERGHATGEGEGQLLGQRLLGRVGNDQVVAVVDDRSALSPAVVEVQRLGHAHAAVLRGEGHKAGIAAEGRADRSGAVIICRHAARRALLSDVAMRLDPAGQDEFARGVDHLRTFEFGRQWRRCDRPGCRYRRERSPRRWRGCRS